MKKRVIIGLLASTMVLSLAGCGNTTPTKTTTTETKSTETTTTETESDSVSEVDELGYEFLYQIDYDTSKGQYSDLDYTQKLSEEAQIVSDAIDKLKTMDTYVIAGYNSTDYGDTSCVTYVNNGTSYLLYADSQDTVAYQDDEDKQIKYYAEDKISSDEGYAFVYKNADDTTDVEIYNYEDTAYVNLINNRNIAYADRLVRQATHWTDEGENTWDIGDGEDTYHVYSAIVEGKDFSTYLALNNAQLFLRYKDKIKDNVDDYNYLYQYLESALWDMDDTFAYSRAAVNFAIDKNGYLRYIDIYTGGAGIKTWYTHCFLFKNLITPENINATNLKETTNTYFEFLNESVTDFITDYYNNLGSTEPDDTTSESGTSDANIDSTDNAELSESDEITDLEDEVSVANAGNDEQIVVDSADEKTVKVEE